MSQPKENSAIGAVFFYSRWTYTNKKTLVKIDQVFIRNKNSSRALFLEGNARKSKIKISVLLTLQFDFQVVDPSLVSLCL
jgi:hypothetical protein